MEYWKYLRSKVGSGKIIIPGADGAILKENKILLVKNKHSGLWFLPGGLQDLNESIEETVLREIQEELGLKCNIKELISVYSNPKWTKKYENGDELQSLTFLFLVDYQNSELKNIMIDEDELSDYDWFDFSNLPSNINDYSHQMCMDIKNYSGKVILN